MLTESVRLLFEQLGISFLLGILVGIQRERSESVIAGMRTIPLIAMLGTLSAAVDRSLDTGGLVVAAGFLGVVAVVVVANIYRLRGETIDFGTTSEAAILLMYFVGAYLVAGERVVAIAVGAAVAVLLQFKPELHAIAAKLGDQDLRAIMTFVLITCVILPVLPNTTYDVVAPLNVLNPFEIWTMVVLIVGISLSGYLIYRFFGRDAGILLGGILGGAISSTATTLSYARRSRHTSDGIQVAALVIVVASTVVFLRVMLEIAVVSPQHFEQLAPPIGVMMSGGILSGAWMWLRVNREPAEMPEQKNPTELRSAMLFGLLYAGVLMTLSMTKSYLGNSSLYVVAVLSGLTDMDAITLSTTRLVRLGPEAGGILSSLGWRLIVVSSMANLLFKWLLVALVGNAKLSWRIASLFTVPFAIGGVLLWFWPS